MAQKKRTKKKVKVTKKEPEKSRAFLFPVAVVIFILAAIAVVSILKSEADPSASATADDVPEYILEGTENTIRLPDSNKPWPNSEEGAIVLWTKPPVEVFEQFSDSREFILFFAATNEPKVRINYNIKLKRFEAGSPLIITPEIDIFAGEPQQLVYTFKKGVGQRLFLNGKMVAESEFKPPVDTVITGFVTVDVEDMPVIDLPSTDVAVYEGYLSEGDLR